MEPSVVSPKPIDAERQRQHFHAEDGNELAVAELFVHSPLPTSVATGGRAVTTHFPLFRRLRGLLFDLVDQVLEVSALAECVEVGVGF